MFWNASVVSEMIFRKNFLKMFYAKPKAVVVDILDFWSTDLLDKLCKEHIRIINNDYLGFPITIVGFTTTYAISAYHH
jgi:hypothetical protein